MDVPSALSQLSLLCDDGLASKGTGVCCKNCFHPEAIGGQSLLGSPRVIEVLREMTYRVFAVYDEHLFLLISSLICMHVSNYMLNIVDYKQFSKVLPLASRCDVKASVSGGKVLK